MGLTGGDQSGRINSSHSIIQEFERFARSDWMGLSGGGQTCQNNFRICKNNFPTCKNNFPTCQNNFCTSRINFCTSQKLRKNVTDRHTHRQNLPNIYRSENIKSPAAKSLYFILKFDFACWQIYLGHLFKTNLSSDCFGILTVKYRNTENYII